jgi:predicted enzyme related to lactoylglutathione lyase
MTDQSNQHEKINYIELPASDIDAVKAFFIQVFSFKFTDYGPEYSAFSAESAGLEGGFFKAPLSASTHLGSALIVFFSNKLEETMAKVEAAGGDINKPIFQFPGGRRFHFLDPCGNEWAVWADK